MWSCGVVEFAASIALMHALYGCVSVDVHRYSLVDAIRRLAITSDRIRLFGQLVGVLKPRKFSKRLCDIILGVLKLLFPKFSSTVMRTRPENKAFVPLYDALQAVRKTFPDHHVPFADVQMPITTERRNRLLHRVETMSQKFPEAMAFARRREQLAKEAREAAEKRRKEAKKRQKQARKAAAGVWTCGRLVVCFRRAP